MLTLLIAAGLTFHALPDGAAEFLSPECPIVAVDCTNTPGSAEWYVPVEKLKLPVTWRITRNGQTVTNSHGSTRIELAPTTGLWPDDVWRDIDVRDWYCGYDVANADYVRLPGESAPDPQYFNLASPEMFCLTWDTYIGITNYHYSALACSNAEYEVSSLYPGRELFKPKSSRFDSVARSALLASYEAYYERLWYASQGPRNEWETDDWGETSDPQRFDFNPTNDLVATKPRFLPSYPTNAFERANDGALRPVPASRRLLDADNITNLIYSVRDLFPANVNARALYDDETAPLAEVMDARPFVFRPHWLTDQRDYPRGDRFGARLWWASTVPPPATNQLTWGSSGGYIKSTTIGLFPEIDNWQTVNELYSAGVPFACYAVTLDMLKKGDGFLPAGYYIGPCFSLFKAVVTDCPRADDAWLWEIEPFDPHGLTVPGFLTNCYPRAAASVPNVEDAYTRYVDVGTDTAVTRRMVPGRLDLVNQLLSVMDRTIMIPSMHVASTNETRAWTNSCRYVGDETTFRAAWNGISWDIFDIEDQYDLQGSPNLTGSAGEEIVDGICARVSATHTTTNFGNAVAFDGGGSLSVDESWLLGRLEIPSTNFVYFVPGNMGLWITATNGNTLGFVGIDGVLEEGQALTFPFKPSVQIERTYRTSHAPSAGNVGIDLGPHQPGSEAGVRANACTSAVLAVKVTDTLGFNPMWRSEVMGYEPGGLADVLASFGEASRAEVINDLTETCGREALTDPAAYIPLPSSARLVLGEIPTTVEGNLAIIPRPTPDKAITNTIYHFTLASPGETVEASHTGRWVLELSRKDYEQIHHTVHTFDSNMVESVESWSEINGPYEGTPYPPTYHDYGTTIESSTPANPIELVFTNSYPPTVEIRGQAVTNTSFRDNFEAYDLEVWHEKEVIAYVYESDHTRDWQEEKDLGSTPYSYPVPMDPVTSNSTTTVELSVPNSLPDDAVDQRIEVRVDWATVYPVFVVNADGNPSVWHSWADPLTGEEHWERQSLPYIVGHYTYGLGLTLNGEVQADVSPEHDPFDEGVFFRVMTQVDWRWNYMRLERKDDQ